MKASVTIGRVAAGKKQAKTPCFTSRHGRTNENKRCHNWACRRGKTSKSIMLYLSAPSDKWKRVALYVGAPARKKQAKAPYFISRHRRIHENRCCHNLARRRGKKTSKSSIPYRSAPSDKWQQVLLYFGTPPRKKQAKALCFISRRRRINAWIL